MYKDDCMYKDKCMYKDECMYKDKNVCTKMNVKTEAYQISSCSNLKVYNQSLYKWRYNRSL